MTATQTGARTTGRIGESAPRPDGTLKVTGEFAYASDRWHDDMVWGVTLRSPHPHAAIVSIDTGPARAMPGVHAVLASWDVPGARLLDVVTVMDRLRSPGGCPWDAKQTHASLLPYLLEETHEVIEAIERRGKGWVVVTAKGLITAQAW